MDRFVVFADILNKINRSNGKVIDTQSDHINLTFVDINLTQRKLTFNLHITGMKPKN